MGLTKEMRRMSKRNEKDILLKILLKMGSIFSKYYRTLNVQLWCYWSVCAYSICFLSIATCQGMHLQHHTYLHVGCFNGLVCLQGLRMVMPCNTPNKYIVPSLDQLQAIIALWSQIPFVVRKMIF